jgi:hypothetical protein
MFTKLSWPRALAACEQITGETYAQTGEPTHPNWLDYFRAFVVQKVRAFVVAWATKRFGQTPRHQSASSLSRSRVLGVERLADIASASSSPSGSVASFVLDGSDTAPGYCDSLAGSTR